MWPKKNPPAVDLTDEAYVRWLQAGRPQPITWFLGLEPEVQATLADLGRDHHHRLCVDIGYTMMDPELAEAGLDAESNPESEEVLLRRVVANAVQRLHGDDQGPQMPAQAPPAEPPPSMAGLGKRREKRAQAAKEAPDANGPGRRLFGREPDPKEAP